MSNVCRRLNFYQTDRQTDRHGVIYCKDQNLVALIFGPRLIRPDKRGENKLKRKDPMCASVAYLEGCHGDRQAADTCELTCALQQQDPNWRCWKIAGQALLVSALSLLYVSTVINATTVGRSLWIYTKILTSCSFPERNASSNVCSLAQAEPPLFYSWGR